jgi:hypothetical protein
MLSSSQTEQLSVPQIHHMQPLPSLPLGNSYSSSISGHISPTLGNSPRSPQVTSNEEVITHEAKTSVHSTNTLPFLPGRTARHHFTAFIRINEAMLLSSGQWREGRSEGLALDLHHPACSLSFPVSWLNGEDAEDLQEGRITRWKEPGSLSHCLDKSS